MRAVSALLVGLLGVACGDAESSAETGGGRSSGGHGALGSGGTPSLGTGGYITPSSGGLSVVPSAGGAGAGGAPPPLVSITDLGATRITFPHLSSDAVYFTTEREGGQYSSETDYSIVRVPKEGGPPQTMLTLQNRLKTLAADAANLYFVEWTDDLWDPVVRRLPTGSGAPITIVTGDANTDFNLAGQLDGWVVVRRHESSTSRSTLEGIDTTSGTRQWDAQIPGVGLGGGVSQQQLRFASLDTSDRVTGYTVYTTGAVTPGATLPNLCHNFLPHPSTLGWIAACGAEAPYDVVELGSSGQVSATLLAKGAASFHSWNPMTHGSTVCWSDGVGSRTFRWHDFDTQTSGSRYLGSDWPFGIDGEYVYVQRDDDALDRVRIAEN